MTNAVRKTSGAVAAFTAGIGSIYLDPQLVNPTGNERAYAGGLRLVAVNQQADRQPPQVPLSSAGIAALISGQSITLPAGYPAMFLVIPANWVRIMFLGTGISPPPDDLQLSTEFAVDARGGWSTWLVQSGLFASFATPSAPLPVLS